MSWDRKVRGSKRGYYYRSERQPGRLHPVKVYLGTGRKAQEAAAQIESNQRRRRAERIAVTAELTRFIEADQLADKLRGLTEVLASAWLLLTGHHQHKTVWRRKRGNCKRDKFSGNNEDRSGCSPETADAKGESG